MTRRYELKQRAKNQEATRQRIVEAAIDLHQAIGPARTTVTQIAERAGVGRPTVYRHFPDQTSLLMACSGRYWEDNPAPDPDLWGDIPDPEERLRVALRQTYSYHRRTAPMIEKVLADVGNPSIMEPYHAHWSRATRVVTSAWRAAGRRRRLLFAAVGHALDFTTWHSLVSDMGLSDKQAMELMIRFVKAADEQR